MGKKYIKVFDERVAKVLIDGGFSYMKEKVNDGVELFVFEDSEVLRTTLISQCYALGGSAQYVEDTSLNF